MCVCDICFVRFQSEDFNDIDCGRHEEEDENNGNH